MTVAPSETCDYLARLGYAALLADMGGETIPADDDPAAANVARVTDYRRIHQALTREAPSPRAYGQGASWLREITWPDRVPSLKTWAGRSTLLTIIRAHQHRLETIDPSTDPVEAIGAYRTAQGEGPSGLDARSCPDAIDIGFSPSRVGLAITCRPAVELLAIVGIESVPIVSFAYRDCGFVADGRMWRFRIEARGGGYFHRWGPLTPCAEID